MSNKEFDKIVKEKLDAFEEDVVQSEELWGSIQSSLEAKELVRVATISRAKKIFYSVSSIAAIFIIALFIKFAPNSTKSHIYVAQTVSTQKTTSQPKEQPNEFQQINDAVLTRTETSIRKTSSKIVQKNPTNSEELYVAEVGEIIEEDVDSSNSNSSGSSSSSVKSSTIDTTSTSLEENISALQENYFADFYEPKSNRRNRKLNFNVSSDVTQSANSSNIYNQTMLSQGNGLDVTLIEQVTDTEYSLPLSVGTQVSYSINSYLSVGLGLNYSMLRSNYSGLINKKLYDIKQTLHYIGIPVNVYASFLQSNRVNCYANIGGAIEKGVQATYKVTSYDDTERYTNSIAGIEYLLNGGVGVEYSLSNTIGIYLEPNIVYYINSEVENSIRTAQPLQFKTEIGLRFNL